MSHRGRAAQPIQLAIHIMDQLGEHCCVQIVCSRIAKARFCCCTGYGLHAFANFAQQTTALTRTRRKFIKEILQPTTSNQKGTVDSEKTRKRTSAEAVARQAYDSEHATDDSHT